jgi:hypothetical protein
MRILLPASKVPALLVGLVLVLQLWPSAGTAADLDEVRADLAKIDVRIETGPESVESMLQTVDIKTRSIYQAYLDQAGTLSQKLLTLRETINTRKQTLTLQQLAAMSQALSVENKRFKRGFHHGEEEFHSYQLIQKAVTNLEELVQYWRLANRYRSLYRGSTLALAEDDLFLKNRLQTALFAIDDLKAIREVNRLLDENLNE